MRRLSSESIERFPLGTWCRKALILGLLAFGGCSALDTQEGYFNDPNASYGPARGFTNEYRTRSTEGDSWFAEPESSDIERRLGYAD